MVNYIHLFYNWYLEFYIAFYDIYERTDDLLIFISLANIEIRSS